LGQRLGERWDVMVGHEERHMRNMAAKPGRTYVV
jgi:hypothetical protein